MNENQTIRLPKNRPGAPQTRAGKEDIRTLHHHSKSSAGVTIIICQLFIYMWYVKRINYFVERLICIYSDMENTRTLSIGITVNLGNYENLHLEVSDTVKTKEDAASLRRFLASVLDDFAQNNASAKEAIDKYKERILDDSESDRAEKSVNDEFAVTFEDMEDPAPVAEHAYSIPEPEPPIPESESAYIPVSKPEEEVLPEPVFVPEPEEIPVEIPEPAIPAVPIPPAQKPHALDEPAGEFICEKCGAPLTKVQRDVSKMFTGKVLCKKCFNGTR